MRARRVVFVVLGLVLVSFPGLAAAASSDAGPAPAAVPLLAPAATAGSCSAALPEDWSPRPAATSCFVSVDCKNGTSVSCSGGTCFGQDRNCSNGQQGYVQCGSTAQYCPACVCHYYCQPCAAYGQTDDCGLTCIRNPNLPNCKRIGAWVYLP